MTEQPHRPREPTQELPGPVRVGGTSLPTDPLRPVRRPGMPWWWVVVALLLLAAVFLAGFYMGREDEPVRGSQGKEASEAPGKAGKEKGGGKARRERRQACRTALDLSLQLVDLQRGALAEQAELAAAVAAEDVGRIDALRESLEAVSAQTTEVQAQLDQAVSTCRG
jgi:hypothetical protein